ncbi:hypothetical protein FACS1894156_9260 [Bacteroidia bacterium]|nr:hypothetical protein FACS1894156_9260 [Bacteroidia bacterium]
MICNDTDFQTALELVKILIQHAAKVFDTLPPETTPSPQPNQKQLFLETLPPEFSRQDYLTAAKHLEIPIRVYDNKLQLWNHGTLPDGITLDQLSKSHSSFPRNPILAGACFLGGYIDSWGSGIMKIVDSCKAAGLPTPTLEEDMGGFMVKLFKDRFTEEQLQKLGLNERQIKAVLYVKEKGKITNSEYQEINEISRRTATTELAELVDKFVLLKNIGFGAGSYYELIAQLLRKCRMNSTK